MSRRVRGVRIGGPAPLTVGDIPACATSAESGQLAWAGAAGRASCSGGSAGPASGGDPEVARGPGAAQAGGGRGRGTLGPQRCHPGHLRGRLRCHSRPWTWVVTGWGCAKLHRPSSEFLFPFKFRIGNTSLLLEAESFRHLHSPFGDRGGLLQWLKGQLALYPICLPVVQSLRGTPVPSPRTSKPRKPAERSDRGQDVPPSPGPQPGENLLSFSTSAWELKKY